MFVVRMDVLRGELLVSSSPILFSWKLLLLELEDLKFLCEKFSSRLIRNY